jgi:hypothetical protein
MNRWQLAIGVALWLTIAWFGFRWVVRPFVWSNIVTPAGTTKTLEDVRRDFRFHVAPYASRRETPPPQVQLDDAEPETIDSAARNWVWRETRNRFVIFFLLWMASGWFIHWFLGRIVRGEKDYT